MVILKVFAGQKYSTPDIQMLIYIQVSFYSKLDIAQNVLKLGFI